MNRAFAIVAAALIALAQGIAAETPSPSPTASVIFVGDIMLDETPGKVIRSGRDPFAPFASILEAADLRIGNLECVVAKSGKQEPDKPFTFRAHPRTLPVLKRHLDVVALSNNHSGDYGPSAFREMLGRLKSSGIGYFGGGNTLAEAHTPLIVERKGLRIALRIALLGYNEFLPRSFEADFEKPGIAWSEDEQVALDIRRARARYGADLVIAFMHWGWEHEQLASDRQRALARILIDAGADAVVGGHPHVTQDVETYRGKPIVYSLGNFVFDGFSDEVNNTGWLLRMELDRTGIVRWQTVVARIDKKGIPHPTQSAAQCWARGEQKPSNCNTSESNQAGLVQ